MPQTDLKTFLEYPPGSGIVIGNFDGSVWGDPGQLSEVGDRVECHCCGKWYILLAAHVWQFHGLLADQYREAFGLGFTQALCSSTYSERKRIRILEDLSSGKRHPIIPFNRAGSTAGKGRPQRLQSYNTMISTHQGSYIDVECSECRGVFRTPSRKQGQRKTCSDICRAAARLSAMANNIGITAGVKNFWASAAGDVRRQELRDKAAAIKQPLVDRVCEICTVLYFVPPYRVKSNKTCGKAACRSLLMSQQRIGRTHTTAAKQRMSDARKEIWLDYTPEERKAHIDKAVTARHYE